MAEKVKLNKNTLREQKQMLALFLEFLPTLELRKQQLQTELRKLDKVIRDKEEALRDLLEGATPWSPMLAKTLPWVKPLVALEEVETHGSGSRRSSTRWWPRRPCSTRPSSTFRRRSPPGRSCRSPASSGRCCGAN